MPWTALSEPSLGLGILKAQLAACGIPCRILHLNLFLLKYLTAATYFGIGEAFALNDFVFTRALEPEISPEQRDALERRVDELVANGAGVWLGSDDRNVLLDRVLRIRDLAVPAFLDDCVRRIGDVGGSLVGFTCLFDQTIPSVALAKLVKKAFPDRLIALGGYSLQTPVGQQVIESFPWIDAVAFGDGEATVVPLAHAAVDRRRLADVPGLVYRLEAGAPPLASNRPALRADLDHSPTPDYDDYRTDLEDLERDEKVTVRWDTLPIESSRGCWWGQTKHCVFCGIDDETLRYRFKSPPVVLEMMASLENRYGLRQFRFSDYILPNAYYRTLLPRLAAMAEPYTLSCELKANLDLTRFRLLRDAGFVEVQPGVESFSTPVLRAMDKGVTAIRNVCTLLLGYRFDIEVHYNFLFGFPTDRPADYKELLRTIPLLYHLTPPISRNNVVTTRFAPMQADPGRFGITSPIRHDTRYEVIFSRAYLADHRFDYDTYCYYFEQPYQCSEELLVLYALLRRQIQYWKDIHRSREVRLSYETESTGLRVLDSRYRAEPEETFLGPDHAQVYLACADDVTPGHRLRDAVSDAIPDGRLSDLLEELVGARLVMRDGNLYLGLAVPAAIYEEGPAMAKSAKWVSPYV